MNDTGLPTPEGTGDVWWRSLSKAEKAVALEPYFAANKSNRAIAEVFKLLSFNSVARVRDDRNQRLGLGRFAREDAAPTTVTLQAIEAVAELKVDKPIEPKPAPQLADVVPIASKMPPERKLPAKSFEVKPRKPAEHEPGTSPALRHVDFDEAPRGGKHSPYPSKNEITAEELRAIQVGLYDSL
ncbi:MAG TPA: hypothetical protein VMR46_03100 [Candidatus Paceibacterota bacterium]|nr:hypothetical protein [Candidatus Paceibacterota bacterium]